MSTNGPYGTKAAETVSVVIPTFDRAFMLERAVLSCLAQTNPVHEVLVCDDGSTDDSHARMAALGDPRVKWLPGPHVGRPAVPRNRGVEAATGKWIAFLDSDDAWLPEKLALQMEHMSLVGTDASCTNAVRIRPTGESLGVYFTDASTTFGLKELLPVNRVICSSVLVKRSRLLQAGGFPEAPELKALEDYALWLRLCALTSFAYCAEPLVLYNDAPAASLRSGSMSVAAQRDAVLSDLRKANAYAVFPRAQRCAITRQLRRARCGSGRPITHWLFLR